MGLRVLSSPASVRQSVRHQVVRARTHHLFKLGLPNLDHRCIIRWFSFFYLYIYLFIYLFIFFFFFGGGGYCLGPFWSNSTSKSNLPHFELSAR